MAKINKKVPVPNPQPRCRSLLSFQANGHKCQIDAGCVKLGWEILPPINHSGNTRQCTHTKFTEPTPPHQPPPKAAKAAINKLERGQESPAQDPVPAPRAESVNKGDTERQVPGGGAFPHVADAAFEGFSAVSEGADATIPKALIGGRFRLSFRPSEESGAGGRGGKRPRAGKTRERQQKHRRCEPP